MNTVTAHAITATVEARIRQLWQQRQRDRRSAMRATWSPARVARETELRALVRLCRSGRRLARQTQERADALSAAKAYRDLGYHAAQAAGPITEPELFAGYGGGERPTIDLLGSKWIERSVR
jgi:hypothetical protein